MEFKIKEKVIYVAAPYGGKEENRAAVETKIKEFIKEYPQYCFVSPIHSFGFLYNTMSYDEGMEHCLTLLDLCTEIWILGDSKGTRIERKYAIRYKIPIVEKG
jgi:hypothetical protein